MPISTRPTLEVIVRTPPLKKLRTKLGEKSRPNMPHLRTFLPVQAICFSSRIQKTLTASLRRAQWNKPWVAVGFPSSFHRPLISPFGTVRIDRSGSIDSVSSLRKSFYSSAPPMSGHFHWEISNRKSNVICHDLTVREVGALSSVGSIKHILQNCDLHSGSLCTAEVTHLFRNFSQ